MKSKAAYCVLGSLAATVSFLTAAAGPSAPALAGTASAGAGAQTVAWQDGALQADTASVIGEHDIVSTRPLAQDTDSMPLGNGQLAAMVWNDQGYTAQLQRDDTWPSLVSAGRLVLPGLSALATSSTSRLSLYNASLAMAGGGLHVVSRVLENKNLLVVDVSGADPDVEQTADIDLWNSTSPATLGGGSITRSPTAFASGSVAGLWETFSGGNGATYGFDTAVTAGAQDVSARVTSPTTAQLQFKPNPDGTFRIVVAVPSFTGGDPVTPVQAQLSSAVSEPGSQLYAAHEAFWHKFWTASTLQMQSPNGDAQYLTTLYDFYLYAVRSSTDPAYPVPPSAGGGAASPFMFDQDERDWGEDIWYWNSRNLVFPNAAANQLSLNDPFIDYYADNLSSWDQVAASDGKPGACVPEITEPPDGAPSAANSCSGGGGAPNDDQGITYVGLEIADIMWKQYTYTDNLAYLRKVYPLMREEAEFFLASLTPGSDGKLHVLNASAEESNPHVNDDVTDLAGIRTAFPEVIAAAKALRVDPGLQGRLASALTHLAPYPLDPDAGNTVAAGVPAASDGNGQYPQMEIAYPDQLVGPYDGASTTLLRRTLLAQQNPNENDWAPEAAQAAQLGMGKLAAVLAEQLADKFQVFPSGFTSVFADDTTDQTAYLEGTGLEAATLQQMALQDNDGVIDVAPAWPTDQKWSGSFSLRAPEGFLVTSQVSQQGTPAYVGVRSLLGKTLKIRNPWPGQQVQLRTDPGKGQGRTVTTTSSTTIEVPTSAGTAYVLQRTAHPLSNFPFQPLEGQQATGVQELGAAQLGVGPVPAQPQLSIEASGITATTPSPGTTQVSVTVRNLGPVSSPATTLRLQDSTSMPPVTLEPSVAVPAIPAGSEATVSADLASLSSGGHEITATVNPDLTSTESNYQDNSAQARISVGSPPVTVTADSTLPPCCGYSSFGPANLTDGSANTWWTSGSGAMPHWVDLSLAQPTPVQSVVIDNRPADGGPAYVITGLTVSTSVSGQPFTVQGSISGNTSTAPLTVTFPQPVTADQVEVTVTGETYGGAARTFADIGQILLLGTGGQVITENAPAAISVPARATADSAAGSSRLANVTDGSANTWWTSGAGAMPHWVDLSLAEPTPVQSVVIDNRPADGGPAYVITSLTVSTSVSGQPFTVQGSISGNTSAGPLTVTFPQPVTADQVEVTVTGETYGGAARTSADIGEILLAGADFQPIGVPRTTSPPPPVTSDPAVITADSTLPPCCGFSTFDPSQVTDGSLSTWWTSGSGSLPAWLDLSLAKPARVQSVVIDNRPFDGVANFVITGLTISTSVAGQPFVVQGSISGNISTNPLTVRFPKPVTADQIRVTVTGENYGSAARTLADISEIELYTPSDRPISLAAASSA